jgi:hypothetical protein
MNVFKLSPDEMTMTYKNALYEFKYRQALSADGRRSSQCYGCEFFGICDNIAEFYVTRRKCNASVRKDEKYGHWVKVIKKEVIDNRSEYDKLVCSMLLG